MTSSLHPPTCSTCQDTGVVSCEPFPCGHGGHTCLDCTTCLAHLRRHPVSQRCPDCAAYISAGL